MKKILIVTAFLNSVFIVFDINANELKQPYLIQRGDETLVVNDMPKFTVSSPISNSFVFINGEYIESPYIVSVSNLATCINGRMVTNFEPWVKKRESYWGRVGITPESVAESVDSSCETLVQSLSKGRTLVFYHGGKINSGMDDGSGALTLINLARKAKQGDEQAHKALINEIGSEKSSVKFPSDWIEKLANNTSLETRATKILEAKREREQKEQERREQQNRQDGTTK